MLITMCRSFRCGKIGHGIHALLRGGILGFERGGGLNIAMGLGKCTLNLSVGGLS